jgi:hypothetical protein
MPTAYYETIKQQDIDWGTSTATKRNPGGGTLTGNQVGVHSMGIGQAATTATWNPGSLTSGTETTTDVTVTGAALGDFVLVSFSLDVDDLALTAQVTSANTVTVQLLNLKGGAATDLGSGTLKVLVIKSA